MSSSTESKPCFSTLGVFVMAFIIALAFSFATDRVWEDYLITYRSSKNLVDGHGLVFNHGERVHTFTSPLGVLVPALCYLISFRGSDETVVWLFHLMGGLALAGAAALMNVTASRLRFHPLITAVFVLWLVTDAKSMDFSINGMETGFMLLFVAWILWSLFTRPARTGLHLGLACGGLLWTRPDGVLYIAALSAAVLIFAPLGRTHREWLRVLGIAAAVCTLVYLPWFVWAWWYYGTPVPHTITAKANAAGVKTLWGALQAWLMLPVAMFRGAGALDGLFTPSYLFYGGWPAWLLPVMRFMAGLASLVWLLPGQRREVRVVSFAASLLMAYLNYCPGLNPAPWYLPAPAWLAFFSLAGLLESLRLPPWVRLAPAGLWLGLSVWLLVEYSAMSAAEQRLVDNGNRRVAGEWLKANARPGDTIFMECLGYFGYYSGLKTYDFPGMSSPEIVRASKKVGIAWPGLIHELKPTWLALRPLEAAKLMQADPALLTRDYKEQKIFDVTAEVEKLNVHGQGLLAFDSTFILFHREEGQP